MTRKKDRQAGFSYIDVMIALVIMMVGILAMVGALSANLVRSLESEKRTLAKQLALSTIESIISAKRYAVSASSKAGNRFAMCRPAFRPAR